MMKDSDLLKEGLRELGFPCEEGQIASFETYLAELLRWNRAHNLTGLRDRRDIVVKHFLDSLAFLKVIPPDAGSMADIGSGAGFPGIPIKIMRPQMKVVLVEPSEKKCVFLRHIRALLGLQGLEVIAARVEDVEDVSVDAAVTRALFSVGEFAKKASGLLNRGGILILSKGPRLREELAGVDPGKIAVTEIRLPFSDALRRIVVVRP